MRDDLVDPVLVGTRLTLRRLRTSDLGNEYVSWMSDVLVNQYLESRLAPSDGPSLLSYIRSLEGDEANVLLAILAGPGLKHIGNIKLGGINWYHRYADIGILIGDRAFWNQGYATEAISVLSSYAFDVLDLHTLTAGFYSANQGSIRAFEKAGFQIKGRVPRLYRLDHGRTDGVMMARSRADDGV